MAFTIRPLSEEDFPQMIEIINSQVPEPTNLEEFLRGERNRPPGTRLRRMAALDEDGKIVGYNLAQTGPNFPPGYFFVRVRIDRPSAGRGVGSALLRDAEEWSIAEGATRLETDCKENETEAVAWVERRGYIREHHIFESTLDLRNWNPEPFLDAVVTARDSGIRFTSLGAEGVTEENFRRYYELNKKLSRDVPAYGDRPFPEYEVWIKWMKEDPRFQPEGVVLAADGERWVALSHLIVTATGNLYQGLTAVDREYRGRNLSLAIKVVALGWAKAKGYPQNRTNNHSANAPMLATNRRLGYVPEPGVYAYYKPVGNQQ